MHLLPFLSLLFFLACTTSVMCTLIGCRDQLTVQVVGPADVSEVSGQITVGGHSFTVDCAAGTDPTVVCAGSTITLQLSDGDGGGEVQWSLSSPSPDSGTGGGGYAGEGAVTPDWSSSQPNGPDCEPTCYTGHATVELLGTP